MTIDTIKLQIPLTDSQHKKIHRLASEEGDWQWVQYQPASGEMRFLRLRGLAETDQMSFHRTILWDVPNLGSVVNPYLTVELSLPKLYYGDNVRLLHEPIKAIRQLERLLNRAFKFYGKHRLCSIDDWMVKRLDCCYCWKFPSQELAITFLSSLKKIDRFPNKQPTIYQTSIVFNGGKSSTYSAKFYLKLPEFESHDAKAMKKDGWPADLISLRKSLAVGILRFEVTLRKKWLQRHEITTLKDVLYPSVKVAFDQELEEKLFPFFDPKMLQYFFIEHYLRQNPDKWDLPQGTPMHERFTDGLYISAPAGEYDWPVLMFESQPRKYHHPGGGMTFTVTKNRTIEILQQMLETYIGKAGRMTESDKVYEKLLAKYKPIKAANLTAFWMFFSKFGAEETKRRFGHTPYYRNRRALREAEVPMIETKGNVVIVGQDFFKHFSMSIPSEYVGNCVDDEPNSQNLLNLLPFERKDKDSTVI